MENFKNKITGFRFIVFIISAILTGAFVVFCNHNEELIQLQGLVLGVVGMATILIGGKTLTDIKGKK